MKANSLEPVRGSNPSFCHDSHFFSSHISISTVSVRIKASIKHSGGHWTNPEHWAARGESRSPHEECHGHLIFQIFRETESELQALIG